ncbi:MAG: cytochrome c [Candidatus Marinimicrobia bacterium]|nr:cytochrome c [Candidatus Neomarinimicrobiota bacterium]
MNKRTLMVAAIILGACLLFFQPIFANALPEDWVAPASADSLQSPIKSNSDSWMPGEAIYKTACGVCHGVSGFGDGIAAVALNPRPADLTSKVVQDQSDGALFWKLTTGKTPMASYKDVYTDQQRWELVEYIRNLEKKD